MSQNINLGADFTFHLMLIARELRPTFIVQYIFSLHFPAGLAHFTFAKTYIKEIMKIEKTSEVQNLKNCAINLTIYKSENNSNVSDFTCTISNPIKAMSDNNDGPNQGLRTHEFFATQIQISNKYIFWIWIQRLSFFVEIMVEYE